MEISRPTAQPLTAEDLADLDKLRQLVEKAIADGVLTQAEQDAIRCQIHADGKVLFEELALCRELMLEKVNNGELIVEWFNQ